MTTATNRYLVLKEKRGQHSVRDMETLRTVQLFSRRSDAERKAKQLNRGLGHPMIKAVTWTTEPA